MRVVCAALAGPGHAYPLLAVARALAGRGHDVIFASGRQHHRDAARAGVTLIDLPRTPGSPLDDLRPYDDAAHAAADFLPALEEAKPDVVVHDVITIGPALAAERLAIPYATFVIHALHTPSRDLPPFGFGAPAGRSPIGRWRDAWMRRGNVRDLERARADLNRARAAVGLPPTDRIEGALSPDLVLIGTLPSLEIARSDWPAWAHVVGPCLWDAEGENPPAPEGEGPLVLVAASTAHDHGVLLRHSLAAVERVGARAIVTAGRSEAPPALPRAVVVAPFADHDAILRDAAATICTGGHGIVARSLSHGVPVIVVPNHGDQRENGYRVARTGAGLRVLEPTARKMRRALARVLREPRFRETARRIEGESAGIDGPARAAELIEDLAARTTERPA